MPHRDRNSHNHPCRGGARPIPHHTQAKTAQNQHQICHFKLHKMDTISISFECNTRNSSISQ